MPKVDLTDVDLVDISVALDMAIKSNRRAQNSGKAPQIREIYATEERRLTALAHRIASANQHK